MISLPQPEVVGCSFDVGFIPPIATMQLRWPAEIASAVGPWLLPNGETVRACLPRRFGVRIYRQTENAYAVALVWDATYRQWFSLPRALVLASSLGPLLASLGTNLDYLLEQPIDLQSGAA